MDLPGTLQGNDPSVSQMKQAPAPWRKFFVHLAGNTNGAHQDFIKIFKHTGQKEVTSLEESDYLLVFCPAVSQVETDISEALESIPAGKPAILVVMHHTFDPNLVVAESQRLVDNPSVHLTVDFLCREGKLLKCQRNKAGWHKVIESIAETHRDVARKGLTDHQRMIVTTLAVAVVMCVLVVVVSITSTFVVPQP